MSKPADRMTPQELELARERRRASTQALEAAGTPLDARDIAMFEMFEREGWSHERRMAYILEHAGNCSCGRC